MQKGGGGPGLCRCRIVIYMVTLPVGVLTRWLIETYVRRRLSSIKELKYDLLWRKNGMGRSLGQRPLLQMPEMWQTKESENVVRD